MIIIQDCSTVVGTVTRLNIMSDLHMRHGAEVNVVLISIVEQEQLDWIIVTIQQQYTLTVMSYCEENHDIRDAFDKCVLLSKNLLDKSVACLTGVRL